jgi:hypothetical protein
MTKKQGALAVRDIRVSFWPHIDGPVYDRVRAAANSSAYIRAAIESFVDDWETFPEEGELIQVTSYIGDSPKVQRVVERLVKGTYSRFARGCVFYHLGKMARSGATWSKEELAEAIIIRLMERGVQTISAPPSEPDDKDGALIDELVGNFMGGR